MNFNEKLKFLRKERNITQEELAERLDVSRQAISKWELGESMPEIDKIVELAKLYDIALDYLLRSETYGQDITKENSPQKIEKNSRFDKKFIVGIILFAAGFVGNLSLVISYATADTRTTAFIYFVYSKKLETIFGFFCTLSLVGFLIIFLIAINIKKNSKNHPKRISQTKSPLKLGIPLFVPGLVAAGISFKLLLTQEGIKTIVEGDRLKNIHALTYESLPYFIISLVIALASLVLLVIGIVKNIKHKKS